MNSTNPTRSKASIAYFRNFIFGVEDSLVSTVGLLSGVAIGGASKGTLLLTGVVLIFVEAFSMAVGSFLSEKSAEHFMSEDGEDISEHPFMSGIVMFVSYFISGFIPLAPYLAFTPAVAFAYSIAASLVALFILGLVSGKISGTSLVKNGLQMFFIGGLAIGIGVVVGRLLGGPGLF